MNGRSQKDHDDEGAGRHPSPSAHDDQEIAEALRDAGIGVVHHSEIQIEADRVADAPNSVAENHAGVGRMDDEENDDAFEMEKKLAPKPEMLSPGVSSAAAGKSIEPEEGKGLRGVAKGDGNASKASDIPAVASKRVETAAAYEPVRSASTTKSASGIAPASHSATLHGVETVPSTEPHGRVMMATERRTNFASPPFLIPASGVARDETTSDGLNTPHTSSGAQAPPPSVPRPGALRSRSGSGGEVERFVEEEEDEGWRRGSEGDALSAYVVSERGASQQVQRPINAEARAAVVPATDPAEPAYDGVPIGGGGAGSSGGRRARQTNEGGRGKYRRRRLAMFGVVGCAVLVAVAAGVATAVVKRRSSELSSGSGDVAGVDNTNTDLPSASPTTRPTASPTTIPTTNRFFRIRSFLLSRMDGLKASSRSALDDPMSPQGKALKWLADEDEREVDLDIDDSLPTSLLQRFVLATLYFSTGGPASWADKCNFLSSGHECTWNMPGIPGVHAYGGYDLPLIGVECNREDVTVGIFIANNNMTGTLPEELFLLDRLLSLYIPRNRLSGPMPSKLFVMPRMAQLILADNALSGSIPEVPDDAINFATNMKYIYFTNNKLNSTIPSSLTQLSELVIFNIENNKLKGTLPAKLFTMPRMTRLLLARNELSGSIPEVPVDGVNFTTDMQYIDLTSNKLNSTIPSSLGRLSKLTRLGKAWNKLTGTVPIAQWGTMSELRMLFLPYNGLTGPFPFPPSTMENLDALMLGRNWLTGSLPTRIDERLSRLENLDVSYNLMTGTIPTQLMTLYQLKLLALLENNFSGTITPSIGNLTSLRDLLIGGNGFHGTLPDTLGRLTYLEQLGLAVNRFNGPVPSGVTGSIFLRRLELHNNSLTGDVPSVCDLPNLYATADCRGDDPEVTCECCDECCDDGSFRDGPTVVGCFPPSQ